MKNPQIPSFDFKLPQHLQGLEDLVDDMARRIACDAERDVDYLRAVGVTIDEINRRVDGMHLLGAIATNPDSLPYKLAHAGT